MQIELKNYFRTNRILKKSHEIYDYLELTRIATVQTPTLRPSSIATLIRYFIRLIPRFRTRFFPSTYSKLHIKKLFNFQVSLFFNNGYETTFKKSRCLITKGIKAPIEVNKHFIVFVQLQCTL